MAHSTPPPHTTFSTPRVSPGATGTSRKKLAPAALDGKEQRAPANRFARPPSARNLTCQEDVLAMGNSSPVQLQILYPSRERTNHPIETAERNGGGRP